MPIAFHYYNEYTSKNSLISFEMDKWNRMENKTIIITLFSLSWNIKEVKHKILRKTKVSKIF